MITGKEMEKLKIIPPDAQIYAQVKASWDKIAKPLDGLGQFETMFAQIGAITGSSSLSIEKKVILTMCADNGIVAEGVSQSGQEVTAVVAGFMGQQASSVGKMARRAGVDVIPVDIGINTKKTLPGVRDCKVMQGTRDFLQEPAMTEEEALQALSVGIDLVRECKDKGYQLIGTGEMGIGNTTTSSMLVAALTGRTAEGKRLSGSCNRRDGHWKYHHQQCGSSCASRKTGGRYDRTWCRIKRRGAVAQAAGHCAGTGEI